MAFTTYANWNAFLSDNNINNFTYVNNIRFDNNIEGNYLEGYIEYNGSYNSTDGTLIWGGHPYDSEYGYSNTFFVFWLIPNDNNVYLDTAPDTIDSFSFNYYNWMDGAPSDGLLQTEEIYSRYSINWGNLTLEDGLYINLYEKWYSATQYTLYEGTDYYIPHGRFFYLDSLDGSPWEGEVNPSKTEMYINAYHHIAPDTNGRIDACKLILDTDKSGENSSIPNGGSFSIGEYNFTKLYEDNNHSGLYYWEDIEHSKITWLYSNVYYLMDKPSDWGSLHNQSFTCYPYNSTENSRTISITGPTEIGLIGEWLVPSTATITEKTLHLKGFYEFNINVSKPEIIIGLKTLVLDNTGYSLTSLGNDDYNLTVPASRWEPVLIDTWLNPGTTLFDEAWITPSNYSKLISVAANNGINVRVDYTNNTSTTFTLTSANSGDSEDEIYEIGVYFGDQENPGYIIGIYPGMQQLWLTQDHSQTLIIQQITFTY